MAVYHYHDDLPDGLALGHRIAIDTETLGLKLSRDRLCLVQLSSGDGNAHLVQIAAQPGPAPNLSALLASSEIAKIFHFGRFDLAVLMRDIGEVNGHIYCTKIASKLVRTYTDRHGLSELARELLNIDMSKQQQSSDWGRDALSEAQLTYAASDVLYLHQIADKLTEMLVRLDRSEMAEACFAFLRHRARLDLAGFEELDIFHH
jgi:ribonuclease D